MIDENEINAVFAFAMKQYGYDRDYKVRFDFDRPYIVVYEDCSNTIVGYVFRRNGELMKHDHEKR